MVYYRQRQDAHSDLSGGCALAPQLGEECAVFGRPQRAGHAGKARVSQSAAGPLALQSYGGQGGGECTRGIFHVSDDDELYRRHAGRAGQPTVYAGAF